jgi:enterochelin esterase-like enzyme
VRRLLLLLAAAAAAAAVAVVLAERGGARPSSALRGTIADSTFVSRALGGKVGYSIYLPPDYTTSGKRYPVVYFLHGLPASPQAYKSIGPIASAVEQSGHEAIVVGAQGSRAGETDPEWLDRGPGDKWETATAVELVSVIDRRYRTLAERDARLLIGISAGGYGATLIAAHHPATYSVIESWSGYFHPTDPTGTQSLDLGSEEANDWANFHKLIPTLKKRFGAYATKTWYGFYVGTDDSRFRAENVQIARELEAAKLAHVVFRIYVGAHDWSLWNAHAPQWVGGALAVAAQPR